MKALIIEDEIMASQALCKLIDKVSPETEVVENADEKETKSEPSEQKEVGRSRVVRDGRVRSILFGDSEPDPEVKDDDKGYISRVEKDGNSTERIRPIRDLRVEPETVKEPVPEEKPKKAPPPINREYFRPP